MERPTDEDFDDMYHALGHPKDAHAKTYRNHYVCRADGSSATRFLNLGWWTLERKINGGRDAVFSVNDAGRDALAIWLKR
jgi:hypothetical protein